MARTAGWAVMYQIAAVSRLTRLSPDLIRAWERRYELIVPSRDATGIRRYSDDDVTRLTLARAATQLGHPIRLVAALSNAEIRSLVGSDAGARAGSATERLVAAVRNGDAASAERIVAASVVLTPVRELVLDILAPAMRSIGEDWAAGRTALWQEHLLSTLVRNVAAVPGPQPAGAPLLFVTPPFELHAFGNVFASMLASARGLSVVNLGTQVPAEEAVAAARRLGSRTVVVTMLGAVARLGQAKAYCSALITGLPADAGLQLAGSLGVRTVARMACDRVRAIETLEAFDRLCADQHQALRSIAKK